MSVRDYLTFTRRERIGIVVLIGLLVALATVAYFTPGHRPSVSVSTGAVHDTDPRDSAGRRLANDTYGHGYGDRGPASPWRYADRYGSDSAVYGSGYRPYAYAPRERSLYYANRYPGGYYDRGSPDWRYSRADHYSSQRRRWAGGDQESRMEGRRRREADSRWGDRDAGKALTAAEPVMRTGSTLPGGVWIEGEGPGKVREVDRFPAGRRRMPVVDINRADTSELIALPGIGSRLAARIVAFRARLGGFTSVEQLRQVYGLRDSVFLLLQPFLRCDSAVLRRPV